MKKCITLKDSTDVMHLGLLLAELFNLHPDSALISKSWHRVLQMFEYLNLHRPIGTNK